MKSIIELTNIMANPAAYSAQFDAWKDKRIVFMNPQLAGKHLYKALLPSIVLTSATTATAIQYISKYDPLGQLLGGKEIELDEKIIQWATHIVFPFTTQPLYGLYAKIRKLSPACKIVYNVDFNFYELSEKHPYHAIFNDESVLGSVEDNIFFSDVTVVSNKYLQQYLLERFTELLSDKYKNDTTKLGISCMPFMIDTEITMANVEYSPEELKAIKKETIHTAPVQEKIDEIAATHKKTLKKTNHNEPSSKPKPKSPVKSKPRKSSKRTKKK